MAEVFDHKPDETDHGLAPDPDKDAALRGRRMSFLDEKRPSWLPPERSATAPTRSVAQVSGRRLNIMGD